MGELKGINHYFIRFVYLFGAWIIALKPIFFTNATKTLFCSTLFLFFVPLFIDYWGIKTNSKISSCLKHVGAYTTLVPLFIILFVSYDGLIIDMQNKLFYGISFYQLWWGLLFWVLLSIVDWVNFTFHPLERKFSEKSLEEFREDLEYNIPKTMDSRIAFHEKQYESELAASSERRIER